MICATITLEKIQILKAYHSVVPRITRYTSVFDEYLGAFEPADMVRDAASLQDLLRSELDAIDSESPSQGSRDIYAELESLVSDGFLPLIAQIDHLADKIEFHRSGPQEIRSYIRIAFGSAAPPPRSLTTSLHSSRTPSASERPCAASIRRRCAKVCQRPLLTRMRMCFASTSRIYVAFLVRLRHIQPFFCVPARRVVFSWAS